MKRTGKLLFAWTLIAAMAFPVTAGAEQLPDQTGTELEGEALSEETLQGLDEDEAAPISEEAAAPEGEEPVPSETDTEELILDETYTEESAPSETDAEEEAELPEGQGEEPGSGETAEEKACDPEETIDETRIPDGVDAASEETQENAEGQEEISDESDVLTLIEDRLIESDESFIQAGRHGTISVNPVMYDKTYSNNTKIQLKFTLRSFGNVMDEYRILIYKGKSVSEDGEVDALYKKVGQFDETVGEHEITLQWDTTDFRKFTEGTYTIQCIASYKEKVSTGGSREVESSNEDFNIILEDYRTVATREFVKRLYTKVFNRNAEDKGLKDWTDALVKKRVTGGEAVRGFIQSEEFANRGLSDSEYVDVLYQTLFDRDADAAGKNNWLDALNNGMSRTFVLKGFVDGAEFHELCGSYEIERGTVAVTENRDKNRGATGFVWRFYQVALGRTADIAGLNYWTGKLVTKKSTPEEVGRGFIFSEEVKNKNLSNEEYVELLYRTFLNRGSDEAGLADWVDRLENGARRETVFKGFSRSAEFAGIVSSFGL